MSRYARRQTPRRYSTHAILAASVGTGQCVLDVGCNEGYIGRACDRSNTFYGIDVDPQALAVAQQHYAAAALVDLNQTSCLPWEVQFDLLIFGDVLEHLVDPPGAYRALVTRYLKPGGRIVVSLPNIANWRIRLDLLLGRFEYTDTGILDRTHLHFYTFSAARKTFASADTRLTRISGGSSLFGALIQALPFTRSLLANTIILQLQYQPSTK